LLLLKQMAIHPLPSSAFPRLFLPRLSLTHSFSSSSPPPPPLPPHRITSFPTLPSFYPLKSEKCVCGRNFSLFVLIVNTMYNAHCTPFWADSFPFPNSHLDFVKYNI
jgi:hypothetical protein